MTLLRYILIALFFIALSLAATYAAYLSELKTVLSIPAEGVTIEVHRGDSLNKVLAGLKQRGVIESSWVSKIYAKDKQLANKIKVGEFRLNAELTIPEMFALITSNKQVKYSITLIEGATFRQALKVLAEHDRLAHTLNRKTDAEILSLISSNALIPAVHPEGLFYPDTYYFQKNDTDISILSRAYQRMLEVLESEWEARQPQLRLESTYQALILASIIEKETGAPEEREQIAGVFTRRLDLGMRLQTDPTVIYGLGERYQGNLKRKHLNEFTPYNTYRIKGLPPTPISLVGRAAIHAALHPAEGKALYFVAKGDGTHQFSSTIEEHNRAVRKYQLKRRTDYRSIHQNTSTGVN